MGYSDLHYKIHHLPTTIEAACLAFVRFFRLQFATLDLIVTPEGEYVFLECNPVGQYGWIQNHTGLPLTETLVDLLAAGSVEE